MLTYKDFDQTSSVFKVFKFGWFTVYESRTVQLVNCLKKKKRNATINWCNWTWTIIGPLICIVHRYFNKLPKAGVMQENPLICSNFCMQSEQRLKTVVSSLSPYIYTIYNKVECSQNERHIPTINWQMFSRCTLGGKTLLQKNQG